MIFKGIELNVKHVPVLDPGFVPMGAFNRAFLKNAKQPLAIVLERNNGLMSVYETYVHGTPEMQEADEFYVERLVKYLIWAKGGFRLTICGSPALAEYIAYTYWKNGARAFDSTFMARVYEQPFEVVSDSYEDKPQEVENPKPLGRHLDGCRIGFDAGGSDRKVSAVMDGESVFSEEVVWFPKTTADPDYHYQGIVDAMKAAAAHMPRVDAIGISSAGIYIDNRTMVASLFLSVPDDQFEAKVKDIYIRAAKEIGDVPVEVANDGDITALAGAMSLDENGVLGIAMGTSEAAGYVDLDGNITGWLNELAFAPIDGQDDAAVDEWSGDKGCGVKYFSQDAIIKLAPAAGIDLPADHSPAEKLKVVQTLMAKDDPTAAQIYATIGCYLGHALAYYADIYEIKHVLLLGRVMSGKGGDILFAKAQEVLADEYPDCQFELHLPDEKIRRVGQSVAAASLPII